MESPGIQNHDKNVRTIVIHPERSKPVRAPIHNGFLSCSGSAPSPGTRPLHRPGLRADGADPRGVRMRVLCGKAENTSAGPLPALNSVHPDNRDGTHLPAHDAALCGPEATHTHLSVSWPSPPRKETKVRRTPPLALRLADAARERRRGDVSRGRVAGRRGLADDELAARDARRDNLEQRGLWPRP